VNGLCAYLTHPNPPNKRVSIIVLNWNGLRLLGGCLRSLATQTCADCEMILVDNASVDRSVEYVRTNFPSVKIIENKGNLGFAEGNNIGIAASVGDYIIILNNDTQVPSNFIQALVECASANPQAGSIGCRIVQEDGTLGYGPLSTNNGFLVPMFVGSNFLPNRVASTFNVEGYCMANCATAVLYKRQALEVTGGFDADFWSDWEDHDLGFRLWLAGYKNFYTTRTHVVHVGAGSFGRELSKDRYARVIRNMLTTYLKNYNIWNLTTRFFLLFWVMLPLRHIVSIVVYELARLRTTSHDSTALLSRKAYLALPEAYVAFLRDLPKAMRKRTKVQALRKVSDSVIFAATRRRWII